MSQTVCGQCGLDITGTDHRDKCPATARTAEYEALRALLAAGEFHHATYRNQGTLWEGLWIYRKSLDGFRGYDVATCISKGSPDLDAAIELLRGTGMSLGAYGRG